MVDIFREICVDNNWEFGDAATDLIKNTTVTSKGQIKVQNQQIDRWGPLQPAQELFAVFYQLDTVSLCGQLSSQKLTYMGVSVGNQYGDSLLQRFPLVALNNVFMAMSVPGWLFAWILYNYLKIG